jgi:hypothetical protein
VFGQLPIINEVQFDRKGKYFIYNNLLYLEYHINDVCSQLYESKMMHVNYDIHYLPPRACLNSPN